MRHITFIAVTLISFILAAPLVFAHHLWIEPSNDAWAVIRGTLPDRIDPYDPDCIREINAFGADGAAVAIERNNEKDRAVFSAGDRVAMATARSEWGYRVNTTRGKRLMGKVAAEKEGLRVMSAFFSTHYAKSLFGPSEAVSEPTGLRFEIIPRKDPTGAKPGDQIEFMVLFDGKPLTETTLYAENGARTSTNADGIAVVAVPDQPIALLYARHRIDIEGDAKKDYDIFTTFLTFEVTR